MIAVVDYGAGNLRSVEKALQAIGAQARLTEDPAEVADADAVVLPGVGAFGDAVERLRARGLDVAVLEVIRAGKPFLGICLGLHLLFDASEESPGVEGLGVLPGEVRRFSGDLKVPHLGWNEVLFDEKEPLFTGVPKGAYFYFAHSYFAELAQAAPAVGWTEYGRRFVCAVRNENVWAVQFHPEKSQRWGLQVLRNFSSQVARSGE